MKLVTLYHKPDCHLCHEVEHVIKSVSRRRRFKLEKRNILNDVSDLAKYQEAIPVVCVDGQEIARYRLTAHQLESALTGE